ncbi:uncharacterized protein LOC135482652 isoform X2 [Lineus longissimus]
MFWLQPELSKETFAQLLSISYCIRTACMQAEDWISYGEMNEAPKVGDLCYARNTNDKKWYRSLALEPSQRMANETNVRFLDFGNQQHIRNDDILPLKEDLELPDIPFQAMECSLYEEEKTFKMDARWAMVDLVKSERLKCKFKSKIEHDGRSVNYVDLLVVKPDGSECSVREFMDKKFEDASKGGGSQPFASRDIRLLEDPHMFDKPKDSEEKKGHEGRATEKSSEKEPGWRERRARSRSSSRSRRGSINPDVIKAAVVDSGDAPPVNACADYPEPLSPGNDVDDQKEAITQQEHKSVENEADSLPNTEPTTDEQVTDNNKTELGSIPNVPEKEAVGSNDSATDFVPKTEKVIEKLTACNNDTVSESVEKAAARDNNKTAETIGADSESSEKTERVSLKRKADLIETESDGLGEDEFFDAEEEKPDEADGAVVSSEAIQVGDEATEPACDESVKTGVEPKCDGQEDTDSASADPESSEDKTSAEVPTICLENGNDNAAAMIKCCDKTDETVSSHESPSELTSNHTSATQAVGAPADTPVDSEDVGPRSDATAAVEPAEEQDPEAEEEYQKQLARFHDDSKVYGLPNYPKLTGQFIKLTIDHPLQKDGSFWACYACENTEQQEEIKKFNDDLMESVPYANPCTNLQMGSLILANFKKKWGRCRVIENSEQAKCKVRFLDTGISARLQRSQLKYLPSSFFSSTHQAVHCSIYQGDIAAFSKDAVKKFADLTHGKELTAQVLRKDGDFLYVKLFCDSDVDDLMDINNLVHEEEKKKKGKRTPRTSPRQDARCGYGGTDQEYTQQGRGPPKILQPVMPFGANPQLYQRQGQQARTRGPVVPDGVPQYNPGVFQCENYGFKPGSGPVYMVPSMGQQQNDAADWPSEGETNMMDEMSPREYGFNESEDGSRGYSGGDARLSGDVRLDQTYQSDGLDQQNGEQRNEGSPGDEENSSWRRNDGYRQRDRGTRGRDDLYDGGRRRDDVRDGYGGYRDGGRDGYEGGGRRNDGNRRDNRQGGRRDNRRSSYGNSRNSGNNRRQSYEGAQRGCFKCGDPSHRKRDCPA